MCHDNAISIMHSDSSRGACPKHLPPHRLSILAQHPTQPTVLAAESMYPRKKRRVDLSNRLRVSEVLKQTKMNKQRSPINCLPTQLLALILDHVIHTHYRSHNSYYIDSWWNLKKELARVSPHCNNVILNSPMLWSTVRVSEWNAPFIQTCLERSQGVPLNIEVEGGDVYRTRLSAPLDAVMRFAHRWRSLRVTNVYIGSSAGREELLGDYVVKKINHLNFPLLRCVVISEFRIFPRFLLPAHSPALEHLQLRKHPAWPDFSLAHTLKTLHLDFGQDLPQNRSFLNPVPTQALTTLSLSGEVGGRLEPQSIHFPYLNKLAVFNVNAIRRFLVAIIAPNLERFIYSAGDGELPSVVFAGLGSKFSNVHHLSLSGGSFLDRDRNGAVYLSRAFPGVQHMEVRHRHNLRLIIPRRWHRHRSVYRVDVWKQLDTLTLRNMVHAKPEDLKCLLGWTMRRKRTSFDPLHLTIYCPGKPYDDARLFERYFDVMKESCITVLHSPAVRPIVYAGLDLPPTVVSAS